MPWSMALGSWIPSGQGKRRPGTSLLLGCLRRWGVGGEGPRLQTFSRHQCCSHSNSHPHLDCVLSGESPHTATPAQPGPGCQKNLPKILLMSHHSPAQKLPAVASHCLGRAQPFHWHESTPQPQGLCLWTRLLSGVSLLCPWCHRLIDSPRIHSRIRSSLPMLCTRKLRLQDTDRLAQEGSAGVWLLWETFGT